MVEGGWFKGVLSVKTDICKKGINANVIPVSRVCIVIKWALDKKTVLISLIEIFFHIFECIVFTSFLS